MKELLVILFFFMSLVTCRGMGIDRVVSIAAYNYYNEDDSVFLKTFIVHKVNVYMDLKKADISSFIRDSVNYEYVDKKNIVITKMKFDSSLLKNAKLFRVKFKRCSSLMQKCMFVLFLPSIHELYIFNFEKMHIKDDNFFLCLNTRGNYFTYKLSVKELYRLFSKALY